ncbi:MAG: lipoyl synthase [Candidatus Brocadiia bacterium]|jgi:lipoic acid synthetase|nr:lipoyl synthase [Candidatus Brocadiia bacterium]
MKASAKKFPPWIKKRVGDRGVAEPVLRTLRELDLATVCQEAHCPNMCECFARGTATFMILGRQCTRRCTFCAVEKGSPVAPDPEEPGRVAEAAHRLGLRHVVVTSVTRDDLPDGGSEQFARTVRAVHECCGSTVEVLTPDFLGRPEDIDRVASAGPEVYNHNVETVPRLYAEVRPGADYARSLGLLERVAAGGPIGKSGMMLGLGESQEEVMGVLADLRRVGCAAVTLGQYLQPSPRHHPVVEFIQPTQFARYEQAARKMGFEGVASRPFARSSYQAGRMTAEMLAARGRSE